MAGNYYRIAEVDAFKYGVDEEPDWFKAVLKSGFKVEAKTEANRHLWGLCHGILFVKHGDFIVYGDHRSNSIWVCTPEKFKRTYKKVRKAKRSN